MRVTTALALCALSVSGLVACGGPLDVEVEVEAADDDGTGAAVVDGEPADTPVQDDPAREEPGEPAEPTEPTEPTPVEPEAPTEPTPEPVPENTCPVGVTCIGVLPFVAEGTTVGGTDRFDSYACAPTTSEAGPERIYRVMLPTAGRLTVRLDDAFETGGVDVDVHILTAVDANACAARDNVSASAVLPAGAAFIVFDSYTRRDGTTGAGAFAAEISFTSSSSTDNVLTDAGVSDTVAALALRAFDAAAAQDLADRPILTVIDFSLPSTARRLWTVDIQTGEVLANDRVTHGSGSGSSSDPAMASSFSNVEGSNKSSLGLARTAETYSGSNGYSLRLDGLEPSNDNMRDRAIVIHGAAYAEDSFVDDNGYLGRSQGCPAVAMSRSRSFIDVVKQGTLVFSYYPDNAWLASSPYLN